MHNNGSKFEFTRGVLRRTLKSRPMVQFLGILPNKWRKILLQIHCWIVLLRLTKNNICAPKLLAPITIKIVTFYALWVSIYGCICVDPFGQNHVSWHKFRHPQFTERQNTIKIYNWVIWNTICRTTTVKINWLTVRLATLCGSYQINVQVKHFNE